MKINIRREFEKLSQYLFAFAIVLSSNSIWMNIKDMKSLKYFAYLLMGLALAGCICFGKQKIKKKNLTDACVVSVGLVAYLLLFWVCDSSRTIGFLMNVVALVVIVVYCYMCDKSSENSKAQFWIYYQNIIIAIAIVSLFFWVLGSLNGLISSTGFVWSSWTGQEDTYKYVPSYYGSYFETQYINLSGGDYFARNTACFTEAPMASLSFSMAFLIELFKRKKISILRFSILLAAIVSTVSTTGYITAIMAIFIRFFVVGGGVISNW